MPMIDIYATKGTFADPHGLAMEAAATVKSVEQVPDIPMFRKNTAAFVHELPATALANVDGDSTYIRVQVLTNAGALNREKQLAVVRRLTDLVVAASSIYGGTDEIQHNIIAERTLGLPREPAPDKDRAFGEVLRDRYGAAEPFSDPRGPSGAPA